MKVVSSYGVKLLEQRKALKATADLYREALSFLIDVVNREWDTVGPVFQTRQALKAQGMVENMVHATRSNPAPKYDFDRHFYKFPSYFRRSAISAALGAVSSYRSNLENWKVNGRKGNAPSLSCERSAPPVFFRGDMSRVDEMLQGSCDYVELKLYVRNDWLWVKVPCRHQDVKYLARHWSGVKASAPVLVEKHRTGQSNIFSLQFAFEESRVLSLRDEPLERRTILSVDMGINSDAVCTVMAADGTVASRRFINFAAEKDRLNHLLNRIKRLQREHGRTGGRNEWRKANRLNDDLSRKIAIAITDMACEYGVNVIVFEKLTMKGKIRGSNRQRLHLWRKQSIQQMVEYKAHRNLIRVSHVCAWGTSRLAFDGSGPLVRNKDNHALAVFVNGKQHNCDLNASYNIGARYFLREYCKANPELLNQLPSASKRVFSNLVAFGHQCGGPCSPPLAS